MTKRGHVERSDVVDAAIALAFFALSSLLVVQVIDDSGKRIVGAVVVLGHVGPLAVRRRWPLGTLAAMSAAAVASVLAGLPVVILGPGVVVAAYTLGARVDRRAARLALSAVIVVMTGVVRANDGDVETLVSNGVVLALAWWLGDRSRLVALRSDAERASAEEAVRRAALDERMRIARELHDVVAHSMTVIAVQAGAARFATTGDDDDVTIALASIERTSRTALEEMRRLLTVLRDDDASSGAWSPAPRLDQVDGLIAAARSTGVSVELEQSGNPTVLPAGLELCAYRIVQEALTNVCKHARARNARVLLAFDESRLGLEISDDGVGVAAGNPVGPGHGLVGMRERVDLYGGTLAAGPRPGGGYRVVASFPIGAAP